MAETVTISSGDSITRILKKKRGLNDHDVYNWIRNVRRINPHISDINRIRPGEKVLIPDTRHETVSQQKIWENALSRLPRALQFPQTGRHHLFWTAHGSDIDSVAQRMFDGGPYFNLPASTKRAVLLHNNPKLLQYTETNRLPGNMMVNITPMKLDKFAIQDWQRELPLYMSSLDRLDHGTRQMFQEKGIEDSYIFARLVQALQEAGASIETGDVIKAAGYGTAGVSGAAASGQMSVNTMITLARQIFNDAEKEFGRAVVTSKKTGHLSKMTRFIKAHPSFAQLMRQVKQLPQTLLPMSRNNLLPPSGGNFTADALARHFRKQYFQAFRNGNSGRYMNTIAGRLNGRVKLLKGAGFGATWVVPSVLGLCSVADAEPELKVRTAFEEGFGVGAVRLGHWQA